jgi:uncharacterized protein YndB with AHSA1/START domain
MSSERQFDFVVDKSRHTITVHREFAAKRELVWDCYTRSELLDQWFAPKPFTTRTKSMDFRERGHWHYAMVDPGGKEYWGILKYLTIKPIEQYTAIDSFCDESGALNPELPVARLEVNFAAQGEHTLVTTRVVYDSLDALDKVIQMGMEEGYTSTLERLDELLEKLNQPGA